jgi:hypothetical protein
MTGIKQQITNVFQSYGLREAKCRGVTHFYLTAVSDLHLWVHKSANPGWL